MSFLSPLYLIGILGVSVPVLIHLYKKKHTVTYQFAAIDFILQSQKRSLGGARFRNILLLILRSLLIAFLAIAMAKPFIADNSVKRHASGNNTIPTANVFIIDNSFSMGYTINDDNNLFNIAKEKAIEVLNNMGVKDEVAIISTSETFQQSSDNIPNLLTDKNIAKEKIDALPLSFSTTEMRLAISKADTLLSSSDIESKRIFIFTDLTENGWKSDKTAGESTSKYEKKTEPGMDGENSTHHRKNETTMAAIAPQTSINIVDVSKNSQLDNISITNIEVIRLNNADRNEVNVKLTISNFSSKQVVNLTSKMFIDGKLYSQGIVNIAPWSTETKEFFCSTESKNPVLCHAEITDNSDDSFDHIAIDNKRFFLMGGSSAINALIVDGDPGVNKYKSESFYLEKSLAPETGHSSNIKPRIMNTTEFEATELSSFDLVILCNVKVLANIKIKELEEFVTNGGSLFITLGDNVEADYYNTAFNTLLPYSLRSINVTGSGTILKNSNIPENNKTGESDSVYLKRPDPDKIFHDIFRDLDEKDIKSINFHKMFLVNPENNKHGSAKSERKPLNSSSVILSYSNNLPAIVMIKYGSGTTALFTSTIDRDWNNLAIKPIFLPIIHRLCGNLTSTSFQDGYKPEILVNETWKMPDYFLQDLSALNINVARIINPGNNATIFTIKGDNNPADLIYNKTVMPGIYRVKAGIEDSASNEIIFAVNIDANKESDLKKINEVDIKKITGKNNVCFITDVKNDNIVYGPGIKKNLWEIILFFAVCTICVEAFFIRR